jgi:MFS transporter, ACS family, hexuronate transporter
MNLPKLHSFPSHSAPSLRTSWSMLSWLLIVQVSVAIVGRSLAPLGPLIGDDLELTKVQIGFLPAALSLGQLFVGIPSGFLVDKWGSRYLLLILSIVLGISYILFAFSSIYGLILVFLFIGGFGLGSIHTTTNFGIIHWFPVNRRGSAMGIKQMGMTLGSTIAILVLLPVAIQIGWRSSLMLVSFFLIFVGVISFVFYRDSLRKNNSKDETLTIKVFMTRLKKISKNKLLWMISLSAAGLSGMQISWNTFIVFYTHDKFEISLVIASFILVVSEIGGSLGRITWGFISDFLFKGNRTIVLKIISILTFATILSVALLPNHTPLVLIFVVSVVFGFCVSGFNGIWMNSATESVPSNVAGMATGFSLTIGSLGMVFMPPFFGWIVDKTSMYEIAWLLLAALSLIILLLFVWMGRIERNMNENVIKNFL